MAAVLCLSPGAPSVAFGHSPLRVRESETAVFVGHEQGSATAVCPAGTRALGGVFEEEQPAFNHPENVGGLITESRKASPTSWRVSARYVGTLPNVAVQVVSIVTCSKRAPKTDPVQATAMSLGGGPASGPSADATCPSGRKAFAGGFSLGPVVSAPFESPVITASRRVGPTTWRASAAEGAGSSVTSIVYCANVDKLVKGTQSTLRVPGTPRSVVELAPHCNGYPYMVGFSETGLSDTSNGLYYPFDIVPQGAASDFMKMLWIHNTFNGPAQSVSSTPLCLARRS